MKGIHYAAIVAVIVIILTVWKRKDLIALATGIIATAPSELAKADGVSVEVESLARTMQSEDSGRAARIGIGWATKNMAKKKGQSITQLVTYSKNPAVNGKYSDQKVSGGKYCASHKSPSRETLDIAAAIIAGTIKDPTGGAIQWDAPKTQDALHKKDPAKFKPASEIANARIKAGRRPVQLDGVTTTRFWA